MGRGDGAERGIHPTILPHLQSHLQLFEVLHRLAVLLLRQARVRRRRLQLLLLRVSPALVAQHLLQRQHCGGPPRPARHSACMHASAGMEPRSARAESRSLATGSQAAQRRCGQHPAANAPPPPVARQGWGHHALRLLRWASPDERSQSSARCCTKP
jgi:hypothetical protein